MADLDDAFQKQRRRRLSVAVLFAGASLLAACAQIGQPEPPPFIATTVAPAKQEFRWSNGKLPKTLDPARAAAAPETDVVRAIYEGLTELDPKTLDARPAVAEKWSSSEDLKTWTFTLRREARWSNGKHVTAADFVSSWKRLAAMTDQVAHREILQNIVGMGSELPPAAQLMPPEPAVKEPAENGTKQPSNVSGSEPSRKATAEPPTPETVKLLPVPVAIFGVEAVNDTTLVVRLKLPDRDLPKLVANPIFRPVFGSGDDLVAPKASTVTNGPFRIAESAANSLVLERFEGYWNHAAVTLERVRFVPFDTAETALDAYKRGELDALTNAAFEPLALKLLAPFDEFHQTTHSALNFYELNTRAAPLSDRRVREAMAISIDREKIAESDLDGATLPATKFRVGGISGTELVYDPSRARDLLEKAGYADGESFPELRLFVNRNETQQRIARTAARMWKQNLNVSITVIPKDQAELDRIRESGDYELMRRGVVLAAADELVGLTTIFGSPKPLATPVPSPTPTPEATPKADTPVPDTETELTGPKDAKVVVDTITDDSALYDLAAIPIYFPRSYALVKPYVRGFDLNSLDAPMLSHVSIDADWRPAANP